MKRGSSSLSSRLELAKHAAVDTLSYRRCEPGSYADKIDRPHLSRLGPDAGGETQRIVFLEFHDDRASRIDDQATRDFVPIVWRDSFVGFEHAHGAVPVLCLAVDH